MANKPRTSYKIDRLINKDLEFGLKTNAILSYDNTNFKITKPLLLNLSGDTESNFNTQLNVKVENAANANAVLNGLPSAVGNLLTPKKYVDSEIINIRNIIYDYLKDSYIKPNTDNKISVLPATAEGSTAPIVKVGLNKCGGFKVIHSGTTTDIDADKGELVGANNEVIGGIVADEYGFIQEVRFKALSFDSIEGMDQNFDNYQSWSLNVGNTTAEIKSSILTKDPDYTQKPRLVLNTSSEKYKGIMASLAAPESADAADQTVTLNLGIKFPSSTDKTDHPIITNDEGAITLQSVSDLDTSALTPKLLLSSIDKFGRVIKNSVAESSDFVSIIDKHNKTTTGLVSKIDTTKDTGNTENANLNLHFYTENGKWATIPYANVKVDTNVSNAKEVSHLVVPLDSSSVSGSTTLVESPVTVSNGGDITATTFIGSGASLTNINFSQLVGEATAEQLPSEYNNLIHSGLLNINTTSELIVSNGTNSIRTLENPTAPSDSKQHNYVPVKVYSSNSFSSVSWADIQTLVQGVVGTTGISFKGVITENAQLSEDNDVIKLGHVGDFYKVSLKPTDDPIKIGKQVLVNGDSLYLINDPKQPLENKDTYATNPEGYWGVIQTNLENPVVYNPLPNIVGADIEKQYIPIKIKGKTEIFDSSINVQISGVNTTLASFDKGGKISVTGNAGSADKLSHNVSLWGQTTALDTEESVSGDIINVGNIIPKESTEQITYNIGDSNKKFNKVFATTFDGETFTGTSAYAKELKNSLVFTNINGTSIVPENNNYTEEDGHTKVFNGKTQNIVDLSATSLGVLKSIDSEILTSVQSAEDGNAISSISVNTNASNIAQFTIDKTRFLQEISAKDNIFDIDNTAVGSDGKASATISFKTTAGEANTFYTDIADNKLPSSTTNKLGLNSSLYAVNFLIPNKEETLSKPISLAQNKTKSLTDNGSLSSSKINALKLLVRQNLKSSQSEYGFVDSGVNISTTVNSVKTDASDLKIPTEKAVSTIINTTKAAIESYQTKCLIVDLSTNKTIAINTELPADTIIEHVDVNVQEAYNSQCSLTLTIGELGDIINGDQDIRLDTEAGDTYTYKIAKQITSITKPSLSLNGSGVFTSGKAKMFIYYVLPYQQV